MRKLYPEHPPMSLRDSFRFGRYKGRVLWKVIAEDPAYVRWLVANLRGFSLDEEAREWLEELSRFGL